jgi:hypothetical protein
MPGFPGLAGSWRQWYGKLVRSLLAVLALVACGDVAPPGFSSEPAVTSVSESTSGSSTSGDTSSTGPADNSTGRSDSSSTGTIRDVGAETDFGTGQPPGCMGKVDLLFLIARSASMKYAQAQLLASFPGFVQTIEERLEDFDVHIVAANPDGEWPGFACETSPYGCPMHWPHCSADDENWICNESVDGWQPCDSELGAGITFNAGPGATNKRCELDGDNRYIISGEPDIGNAFECIAKVGTGGGYPATGDALIAAVSPKLNGPTGCNAGFLRDDALLVVAIIDNTYDEQSLSSAYTQYDKVIAAKKDPDAVVMLAITAFPLEEGEPEKPDCVEDLENAGNYLPLLEMFPYHLRGDACADSYVPFFDDAVSMIDEACGSFVPQ